MNKIYIELTCVKKKNNFILLESIIESSLGISRGKQFKIFFKNDENDFYVVSDKSSSDGIKGFLGYMFITNIIQEREIKLAELSEESFWSNFKANMQGILF
jgi:hypothetical protein